MQNKEETNKESASMGKNIKTYFKNLIVSSDDFGPPLSITYKGR